MKIYIIAISTFSIYISYRLIINYLLRKSYFRLISRLGTITLDSLENHLRKSNQSIFRYSNYIIKSAFLNKFLEQKGKKIIINSEEYISMGKLIIDGKHAVGNIGRIYLIKKLSSEKEYILKLYKTKRVHFSTVPFKVIDEYALDEVFFHQEIDRIYTQKDLKVNLLYFEDIPVLQKTYIKGEIVKSSLEMGTFNTAKMLAIDELINKISNYNHKRGKKPIFKDLNPANLIYTHTGKYIIIDGYIQEYSSSSKKILKAHCHNIISKLPVNKFGLKIFTEIYTFYKHYHPLGRRGRSRPNHISNKQYSILYKFYSQLKHKYLLDK